MEVIILATSSITHNFVISGPERVQRFIDALDAADKDRAPKEPVAIREVTDPKELSEFMARWDEKHKDE